MKTTRNVVAILTMAFFLAPAVRGQDFSKYRTFRFGMTLADLSKQTNAQAEDVKLIHDRPARIQELTWWPPPPYGTSGLTEPVGQIEFSFYNGALYRMVVTYDSSATKGLTDEDMTRVISDKYGTATKPEATIAFPTGPSYRGGAQVISRWQDSQYSLNLVRTSSSSSFALVMYTKQLDAQAASSIVESEKLDQQEAPQKETARAKKEAADLEGERQKNMGTFRP